MTPRRSVILDTVTRAAFPPVLVFAVYLLFVGHNAPGGGFVSGLTAGIALTLLYAGGGIERLHDVVRLSWESLLGLGLLLSGSTGLASLVLGEPFLSSAVLEADLPVFGTVKLVTVLFFDAGVTLIVLGLVLALLTILGHRSERGVAPYGEGDGDAPRERNDAPREGDHGDAPRVERGPGGRGRRDVDGREPASARSTS